MRHIKLVIEDKHYKQLNNEKEEYIIIEGHDVSWEKFIIFKILGVIIR